MNKLEKNPAIDSDLRRQVRWLPPDRDVLGCEVGGGGVNGLILQTKFSIYKKKSSLFLCSTKNRNHCTMSKLDKGDKVPYVLYSHSLT